MVTFFVLIFKIIFFNFSVQTKSQIHSCCLSSIVVGNISPWGWKRGSRPSSLSRGRWRGRSFAGGGCCSPCWRRGRRRGRGAGRGAAASRASPGWAWSWGGRAGSGCSCASPPPIKETNEEIVQWWRTEEKKNGHGFDSIPCKKITFATHGLDTSPSPDWDA